MKKLNKKVNLVNNSIEAYWTCNCTCSCTISSSYSRLMSAGSYEGMILFGGDDYLRG